MAALGGQGGDKAPRPPCSISSPLHCVQRRDGSVPPPPPLPRSVPAACPQPGAAKAQGKRGQAGGERQRLIFASSSFPPSKSPSRRKKKKKQRGRGGRGNPLGVAGGGGCCFPPCCGVLCFLDFFFKFLSFFIHLLILTSRLSLVTKPGNKYQRSGKR